MEIADFGLSDIAQAIISLNEPEAVRSNMYTPVAVPTQLRKVDIEKTKFTTEIITTTRNFYVNQETEIYIAFQSCNCEGEPLNAEEPIYLSADLQIEDSETYTKLLHSYLKCKLVESGFDLNDVSPEQKQRFFLELFFGNSNSNTTTVTMVKQIMEKRIYFKVEKVSSQIYKAKFDPAFPGTYTFNLSFLGTIIAKKELVVLNSWMIDCNKNIFFSHDLSGEKEKEEEGKNNKKDNLTARSTMPTATESQNASLTTNSAPRKAPNLTAPSTFTAFGLQQQPVFIERSPNMENVMGSNLLRNSETNNNKTANSNITNNNFSSVIRSNSNNNNNNYSNNSNVNSNPQNQQKTTAKESSPAMAFFNLFKRNDSRAKAAKEEAASIATANITTSSATEKTFLPVFNGNRPPVEIIDEMRSINYFKLIVNSYMVSSRSEFNVFRRDFTNSIPKLIFLPGDHIEMTALTDKQHGIKYSQENIQRMINDFKNYSTLLTKLEDIDTESSDTVNIEESELLCQEVDDAINTPLPLQRLLSMESVSMPSRPYSHDIISISTDAFYNSSQKTALIKPWSLKKKNSYLSKQQAFKISDNRTSSKSKDLSLSSKSSDNSKNNTDSQDKSHNRISKIFNDFRIALGNASLSDQSNNKNDISYNNKQNTAINSIQLAHNDEATEQTDTVIAVTPPLSQVQEGSIGMRSNQISEEKSSPQITKHSAKVATSSGQQFILDSESVAGDRYGGRGNNKKLETLLPANNAAISLNNNDKIISRKRAEKEYLKQLAKINNDPDSEFDKNSIKRKCSLEIMRNIHDSYLPASVIYANKKSMADSSLVYFNKNALVTEQAIFNISSLNAVSCCFSTLLLNYPKLQIPDINVNEVTEKEDFLSLHFCFYTSETNKSNKILNKSQNLSNNSVDDQLAEDKNSKKLVDKNSPAVIHVGIIGSNMKNIIIWPVPTEIKDCGFIEMRFKLFEPTKFSLRFKSIKTDRFFYEKAFSITVGNLIDTFYPFFILPPNSCCAKIDAPNY